MAPFHPASGRTVYVRADMPMNTMSTIKIAIMLLAYRDADRRCRRFGHMVRPYHSA